MLGSSFPSGLLVIVIVVWWIAVLVVEAVVYRASLFVTDVVFGF